MNEIKHLTAQLMLAAFGVAFLLGDAPTLTVSDQEMAVSMTIPVEENISDIEVYWTTVPEFLGSLKSISDAERESLRAILGTQFPVEVDLRYEDEGIPYSLRFWIKDGEIVRSFVRSTVTEYAIGPDLAEVQGQIERIMDERFREGWKQSDEAMEDLQRRAAEQRKMIEEMEGRSREHSEHSDQR